MKLFTLLTVLVLTSLISLSDAQAIPDDGNSGSNIAPQPCDTQYWKQMSARAWMEAEREIMQNQNLIFKPDSVLEYVCFDQFVSLTAHEAGKIFTHTNYFGAEIIPTTANEGLPKALEKVVYAALGQYIEGSFSHKFLGGRAEHLTIGNKDSQFSPPSTPIIGGYTCNEMSNVWRAAKCSNFVDNAEFDKSDGFYPFEGIKGHNGTPDVKGYDTIKETRLFPSSCRSGTGSSAHVVGPEGTWKNYILSANNLKLDGTTEFYKFSEPLKAIYEDVGNKLEPGNCGQDGIATGVTIYKQGHPGVDGGKWLDGVCTNPGCTYRKGTADTVGKCVPATATATAPYNPEGSGSILDDPEGISGAAG
jgi:hypothetical protein